MAVYICSSIRIPSPHHFPRELGLCLSGSRFPLKCFYDFRFRAAAVRELQHWCVVWSVAASCIVFCYVLLFALLVRASVMPHCSVQYLPVYGHAGACFVF